MFCVCVNTECDLVDAGRSAAEFVFVWCLFGCLRRFWVSSVGLVLVAVGGGSSGGGSGHRVETTGTHSCYRPLFRLGNYSFAGCRMTCPRMTLGRLTLSVRVRPMPLT